MSSTSDEWQEITRAREESRYELHLNGTEISERLDRLSNRLPRILYDLEQLNFLEISDTSLEEISNDIEKLSNLLHLALYRNKLANLPVSINKLEKLKFLDVSFNDLTQISFPFTLSHLQTLNLSNNTIEQFDSVGSLNNLAILHLEHNKLSVLPCGIEKLSNLSELHVSNNMLTHLPSEIGKLSGLRVLDASFNQLKDVSTELSQCRKLKTLDLTNNPLQDKRLKKMTSQCSPKAILDYIAKHGAKQEGGGGKKKGKGKKASDVKTIEDEEGRKIIILQDKSDERRVVSESSVKDVRPFICCLIFKQLDLRDTTMFKKFLTIQTKLHENECDMRTRATIATHSADKVTFPVRYLATEVEHLVMMALGKTELSSAAQLIENLKRERDELKQKKKRQPKTGLYKFIDLVDGKTALACVKNADDVVISLPPITNSETTKIKNEASDVVVEITSPLSISDCKYVMESLIRQMFSAGFTCIDSENASFDGLLIEPLRVVDSSGDLRCIYPSKVDLQFDDVFRR